MKKLFKLIIFLLIIFSIVSCNDPIFYMISEEIPLLEPLINGSPVNFTAFNSKLYVASGTKIYSYPDSNNKWVEWQTLNDFIMYIAATDAALYALYLDNNRGRIRNCTSNQDVNLIVNNENLNIQSIHASEDILFVSARDDNNNYTFYYRRDGTATFNPINIKGTDDYHPTMINSVAYDAAYFYLCATSGISYVRKTDIDSIPTSLPVFKSNTTDGGYTGIIALGASNRIAVITEYGKLYQIYNASISSEITKFTDSRNTTGALAVWYKNNTDTAPSLLLVGRKEYYYSTTTGYSNGYVEIALDTVTGGIKSGASFAEPGVNTLSTIDNKDRYVSSMGKKPINHIIQTPANIDSNMTLFASTQQDGVWSYRNRNDLMQWNAEQ